MRRALSPPDGFHTCCNTWQDAHAPTLDLSGAEVAEVLRTSPPIQFAVSSVVAASNGHQLLLIGAADEVIGPFWKGARPALPNMVKQTIHAKSMVDMLQA